MTDDDKRSLAWMGLGASVLLGVAAIAAWRNPGGARFVSPEEAEREAMESYRKMIGRAPTSREKMMMEIGSISDGRGGMNLPAMIRLANKTRTENAPQTSNKRAARRAPSGMR